MHRLAPVALLLVTFAVQVHAQAGPAAPAGARASANPAPFTVPSWAYPVAPTSATVAPDSTTKHRVPHSRASFTAADAADFFRVLDWHPSAHPATPTIVAYGRKPAVFACGYCHLADGIGRPENAMLASLPAPYIVAQVADIRTGARRSALDGFPPFRNMYKVATNASDAEIEEAAAYFAGLRARARSRVVEVTRIPRVVPAVGLYFRDPRGGTEPLGNRLIEVARDAERHELHDPFTPYIAYVPPGSVARGRALAARGRGEGVKACASCHGPALRGVALVPPIAGRSPTYLLHQLIAFRTGARSAASGQLMRDEVSQLSLDDMIAVAAYAASLQP